MQYDISDAFGQNKKNYGGVGVGVDCIYGSDMLINGKKFFAFFVFLIISLKGKCHGEKSQSSKTWKP